MAVLQDYEARHLEIMRRLAPECMVLLKRSGAFPLSAPGRVALYGSGARRTIKGGTGSGDVNSRFYVTVEQGLKDAGFTITTSAWLDGYDTVQEKAHEEFLKAIRRKARQEHTLAIFAGMGAVMPEPEYDLPLEGEGDTAIYVLSRISGEGNDRNPVEGDIRLTPTEVRDILACKEKYARFLLVLNVGGVIDLSPVQEVQDILILSQLGAVTGQALADVVLGSSVPSGKLSTTWSRWEDYADVGTFGERNDTDYKEGIYVGYRWFDSVGKRALYPFGFGLGYTDFALGQAKVRLEGTQVTVSVPVENVGRYSGKEVVQLYASLPWGKLDQPYQTLAAFGKTGLLSPGWGETVELSFSLEELAGYDEAASQYLLEQGEIVLRVGSSSVDTVPAAVLVLNESVVVRQVSPVGGKPEFTDWKPEAPIPSPVPESVPRITVDTKAFAALKWPTPAKPSRKASEFVSKLSNEKLLYLCIGSFRESDRMASVIGSASSTVAGAAGEITSKIEGVANLVMADGPAGLRLSQHYTRDEKGAHAIGSTMPAGVEDLMGPVLKWIVRSTTPKAKGEVLDQYTTAIPIGTGLAQSWNEELCEECGGVVGKEMERFHVQLWLAPAFNIHRSPLCGRNFEYLSEDPLISGKLAAALTRGVQRKACRGVTVKHFCCNNQETERYTNSSNVSERALREIYVRGFGICLQEADPRALMTSYNLLNGLHTSERMDLMQILLREEWGWNGLVMTDWVIAMMSKQDKYRMAKPAPTLQAGNDLFMPGSVGDYKSALKALQGRDKDFPLTRSAVERCAAHVVDTVWKMSKK